MPLSLHQHILIKPSVQRTLKRM